MIGSILFASNASTAAAAQAAAAITASSSGTYNQLLTSSATTALNAWMSSSTSTAILNSTSYAGLTIPPNFTYTLLNVTNVAVINATVSSTTVESLLGITSSTVHYALEVWLNITVQVGYSVAASSSDTSRRRLLQQAWGEPGMLMGDAESLMLYDSSTAELGPGAGQLDLARHQSEDAVFDHHSLMMDDSNPDVVFGRLLSAAETSKSSPWLGHVNAQRQRSTTQEAKSAGQARSGGRRLQQSLSYSWLSPLDLQLALLKTAFAQTAQCNATAVALQLGTSSSLSSLNCPSSATITLLTDLLAASATNSDPALSVLMVSTSPKESRSTGSVNSTSGVEASVASTLSILLHGYQLQIAELLDMTIKAVNTVDTLGSSMAGTYIKAFITTAQNYISAATTYTTRALAIFDKSLTASKAIVSVSAYTQLVQSTLAATVQAQNALELSSSFEEAVAALAPNCTSRDSLGNAQFAFLLAADESKESFANSNDTVSVTAAATVMNETASDCPPQLQQKKTGYCVSTWNGYSVVQVTSMPERQARGEQVVGRRHAVGFDGNVVVGGLLVHQVILAMLLSKPHHLAEHNCHFRQQALKLSSAYTMRYELLLAVMPDYNDSTSSPVRAYGWIGRSRDLFAIGNAGLDAGASDSAQLRIPFIPSLLLLLLKMT